MIEPQPAACGLTRLVPPGRSAYNAGMFKWIFKWVFRLFLLAVVLVVIFFLSLDSLLRLMVEHNIRANTGMDAEIGRFHVGLTVPVVEITDLKLYNTPDFGGTPFLSIPEIHVEYDPVALAKKKLHLTLMRFNLGELDIVKNEAGRTNVFELGNNLPAAKPGGRNGPLAQFKAGTGLDFEKIDVLNVSVGKFKYIDLKNQRNNREQDINLENIPIRNVKSANDLAGLAFAVALRSGTFFGDLVDQKSTNLGIFKQLGF